MQSFYVCAYGRACPLFKGNLTLTFKKQNITGKIKIPASPRLSHRCNICLWTVDSSSQCKASVFDQLLKENQASALLSGLISVEELLICVLVTYKIFCFFCFFTHCIHDPCRQYLRVGGIIWVIPLANYIAAKKIQSF